MNQLFMTLRDAESCAAAVLPLIDEAIEMRGNRRLWRRKLEVIRDRVSVTVIDYGSTDFLDDDGSPYYKLFDALAYLAQAARAYEWDGQAVNAARDLLVSIAR